MANQRLSLGRAYRVFHGYGTPWLLLSIIALCLYLRLSAPVKLTTVDALLIVGTALYWPLQEWWMHRWLLHMKPLNLFGFRYEPPFARVHRLHHAQPKALEFVFIPMSAILLALVVYGGVVFALTQSIALTSVFLGAAAVSTYLYEWIHFLTHTDYVPKGDYYRAIWRLHRWHHYKNESFWFGLTVPWIDGALGTGPSPKDVPKSATVLTLGSDEDRPC